jgi:hypothetical protein
MHCTDVPNQGSSASTVARRGEVEVDLLLLDGMLWLRAPSPRSRVVGVDPGMPGGTSPALYGSRAGVSALSPVPTATQTGTQG